MMKKFFLCFILFLSLWIIPEAFGHKMLIDILVEKDKTVRVDAFFPDGTKVKGAKIEVFKPNGELFIKDKTDDEGGFSFKPKDIPGKWKVVVTGTMGHRAEKEFMVGAESSKIKKEEKKVYNVAVVKKEAFPFVPLLAGLGFIFGLLSFIMVLKINAKMKKLDASRG